MASHALQDQLTESVVGAIATQIERAEIRRATLTPSESFNAYDYYLRGMARFHQGTREAIDEALPLLHKAIEVLQPMMPIRRPVAPVFRSRCRRRTHLARGNTSRRTSPRT